jgi:hypothetical protein
LEIDNGVSGSTFYFLQQKAQGSSGRPTKAAQGQSFIQIISNQDQFEEGDDIVSLYLKDADEPPRKTGRSVAQADMQSFPNLKSALPPILVAFF